MCRTYTGPVGRVSKGDRVKVTVRLQRGAYVYGMQQAKAHGLTLGEYLGHVLLGKAVSK